MAIFVCIDTNRHFPVPTLFINYFWLRICDYLSDFFFSASGLVEELVPQSTNLSMNRRIPF